MNSNGTFSTSGQSVPVTKVSSNLGQVIIETTEDKLELALRDYLHLLEKGSMWVAPFGVLVTITLTYCTTSFKEAYLKADTWQGFFLFLAAAMLVWLIYSLRAMAKSKGIPELIKAIKGEA